ncbi:hypothetical protein K470DRAFT_216524 [Piedraia hortae CBS 480.64]|uniref:DASH complex subunit Hsk3 like-domain-containing protein n=1 Tax=Piedraia hortae CBS 480.64 TaxID=1314780 RepID=A0A6A7C073_9PEZI|nr:hypothetical protein K470DRAFT_216524 [Piedraia hortae CBS 480.64]
MSAFPSGASGSASVTMTSHVSKARQLSHLQAQLAQLTANMSDLENLVRMTSVQAESMRALGGYVGALFMASSKVLGEDTMGSNNANSSNVRAEKDSDDDNDGGI